MITCPICKKDFKSLGFGRHRTMHSEDKNRSGYVYNGHSQHNRHKCSICGKVRFEKFMKLLGDCTRYGNECWGCNDQTDERHNESWFNSY